MDRFDAFIADLSAAPVAADAFNHYAPGDESNAVRRANLSLYFSQMAARQPRVLLVGEAPGYQGCRRTGIPFTSDYTLLNPPDGVPIFGTEAGYRMAPEFDKLRKEPSGTILWNTIAEIGLLPLIWSAYPFHPHKPDKPLSNRAPRAAEVQAGQPFLTRVLELFPCEVVVAVGNKADGSLSKLGIDHEKVRHPSQGGKADFVAGMQAIAARYG